MSLFVYRDKFYPLISVSFSFFFFLQFVQPIYTIAHDNVKIIRLFPVWEVHLRSMGFEYIVAQARGEEKEG